MQLAEIVQLAQTVYLYLVCNHPHTPWPTCDSSELLTNISVASQKQVLSAADAAVETSGIQSRPVHARKHFFKLLFSKVDFQPMTSQCCCMATEWAQFWWRLMFTFWAGQRWALTKNPMNAWRVIRVGVWVRTKSATLTLSRPQMCYWDAPHRQEHLI